MVLVNYLDCYPKLIDSLQSGGVVIADEMDAKLHPKLFRYIIELFTNPETNRNGAQLLINFSRYNYNDTGSLS